MSDVPQEGEVGEWLGIARRDWRRLHVMLADLDASGAGFYLQQSLQKYLKGFLIAKGWRLKKIHALQALLDDVEQYQADVGRFRGLCERVSGYYVLERYPYSSGGPEVAQINADLTEARDLVLELFPDEALRGGSGPPMPERR